MSINNYISLGKNQFFDPKRKVIVEIVGYTEKIVGYDRRRINKSVMVNKRVLPSDNNPDWITLGNNLFFNKPDRVIMKKIGAKMVLFSRDRRSGKERRYKLVTVPGERRTVQRRK